MSRRWGWTFQCQNFKLKMVFPKEESEIGTLEGRFPVPQELWECGLGGEGGTHRAQAWLTGLSGPESRGSIKVPQLRSFFFSIFQEGFSGENEAETFCCDNSGSTQSLGCLLTSLPSLPFPQGGNFCPLVSLLRSFLLFQVFKDHVSGGK